MLVWKSLFLITFALDTDDSNGTSIPRCDSYILCSFSIGMIRYWTDSQTSPQLRQLITVRALVWSQHSAHAVCWDKFFSKFLGFPLSIIPLVSHIYFSSHFLRLYSPQSMLITVSVSFITSHWWDINMQDVECRKWTMACW
jgi:hypothetical protein